MQVVDVANNMFIFYLRLAGHMVQFTLMRVTDLSAESRAFPCALQETNTTLIEAAVHAVFLPNAYCAIPLVVFLVSLLWSMPIFQSTLVPKPINGSMLAKIADSSDPTFLSL